MNVLTTDNYKGGFLVDEDLMAGVTQHPEQTELFIAFVLRHSTGEYLGYQPFSDLNAAIEVINKIPRPWTYEKLGGGCGNGNCGNGQCAIGGCGKNKDKKNTKENNTKNEKVDESCCKSDAADIESSESNLSV